MPAMDKSVTLMVPVYGTAQLAEKLVRALPGFRAAAESIGWRFDGCIVVDDGSPNKETPIELRSYFEGKTRILPATEPETLRS